MKKTASIILSLLFLLQAFSLTSCSAKNRYSRDSFEYFDTVVTVEGYAKNRSEFDSVCDEIFKEIEAYHRLFDIYNEYDGINNLCSLNALHDGEHKRLTVDKKILDLLLFSKDIYKKTDGKVNVAMGSVLSIWHSYRSKGKNDPASASLPSKEELSSAALHTSIDAIEIDEKNSTVFLSDSRMTLDVGAVAKGYTAEMLAQSLTEKGIFGYVLNLGGNIRTLSPPKGIDGWEAVIENPVKKKNTASLLLSDISLVTSGSEYRFYTVEGKKYHHIIDPKTLMPAENGYASVSVLTKSSAHADALSTALFCMSIEEGKKLIEKFDGTQVLWIYSDGSLEYTDGFGTLLIK